MEPECYERYPARTVLLSNAVAVGIYALGAVILARLGVLLAVAYVLYCLWAETALLRKSCAHCYYYGKVCAFGKGWLCARLLRKADPQRFSEREVSWRDLIPDMFVLAFPLIGGVVGLVLRFSWLVLGLMVVLVALSTTGNAVVRGRFACVRCKVRCKQRELGCPAAQLFGVGAPTRPIVDGAP